RRLQTAVHQVRKPAATPPPPASPSPPALLPFLVPTLRVGTHVPDALRPLFLFGAGHLTPPLLPQYSMQPAAPSTIAVAVPAASKAARLDTPVAPWTRPFPSLHATAPPPGAAPRPTAGTRGRPASAARPPRPPAVPSEMARASARRTPDRNSIKFFSSHFSQLVRRGSPDPAA